MIFVTVGTHGQQFNRLVQAIDELPCAEERIVQYGHSTYLPVHCQARAFLSFDETKDLMASARVVLAHAGTGTIMLALSLGKIPIAAPRLARFGEHVDDHQLELVQSLSELGLVVPYFPGHDLAKTIETAGRDGDKRVLTPSSALIECLARIIDRSSHS